MDAVRVVCFHARRNNKELNSRRSTGIRDYLSVINMPNGTDVHVWFCSREFIGGICVPSPCGD